MYDPKNEAHEFTDTGRDSAIAKACQYYNVEADELEIRGYADGAVYGLSTRTVIVAIPKGRSQTRSSSDSRDRGGRCPPPDRRAGIGGPANTPIAQFLR